MRITEFTQSQLRTKAGIIPYYVLDGVTQFMFMIPSDPAYGGTSPNIAKGGVEDGENVTEAAIREGEEELGLKRSNFVASPTVGFSEIVSGLDATYKFTVYTVEVKDPTDFSQYHYETKETLWLTAADFASSGRSSQRKIVTAIAGKV